MKQLVALTSFVILALTSTAQIAGIDGSFSYVGTGLNGRVNALVAQSDLKVVVGGQFQSYDGVDRKRIARLNADGSLDESFNVGTGFDQTVNALQLQTDGKIIAGGQFDTYDGTASSGIARINPDGTLDATFNIGTGLDGGFAYDVLLQSDGKIIVTGGFSSFNGTPCQNIVRLDTDGTMDATFTTTLGNNGWCLAEQSDGKIMVGGQFSTVNAQPKKFLVRLNSDGSTDSSFDTGVGPDNTVHTVVVQTDGKIVAAGGFTDFDGTSVGSIVRLTSSGARDVSFLTGDGFSQSVDDLALQSDGKILAVGEFSNFNVDSREHIARLNSDGTLDLSFDPGTGLSSVTKAIAVLPDGRIMAGGDFTSYNGSNLVKRVVRILNHSINGESISPSGAFCAGDDGQVTYSIIGSYNAGNVFTVQLSDATGDFSNPVDIGSAVSTTAGTIPFTIPSLTSTGTSYRIRVVGSNPPAIGTDAGATSNLVINALPTPSVTPDGPTTFCQGESVMLTASANALYQWSNGPTDQSITVSASGTYSVAVTDANGCTGTSTDVSVTVNMNPSPVITPGGPTSFCQGGSVMLTASSGVAYQWSNGPIDQSITVTQAGVYFVVVIDANGCEGQSSPVVVTTIPFVTPSVTISADPGDGICEGNEVTFTAVPSNGGGTPSYAWMVNGNPVGTGSDTYTNAGLQDQDEVECVLTSNEACVSQPTAQSNTIVMDVSPTVTPDVVVIADPAGTICPGTEVSFLAIASGGGDPYSYSWTLNGSPVGGGTTTYTSPTLQEGDEVICSVTSGVQCVDPAITSDTVIASVASTGTAEVSIQSDLGTDICSGQEVVFTATPVNGGVTPSYQWKINGTDEGTDSDTFTTDALANGDVVTCTLTSSDPCVNPQEVVSTGLTISVSNVPDPPASINGNTSVCFDEEVTYSIDPVAGADSYVWTLPFGWTGSSTGTDIAATSTQTGGQVTVAVVNSCGTGAPRILNVQSFPAFSQLSGDVLQEGSPIQEGMVYAILFEDTGGVVLADSALIEDGQYDFGELPIYPKPFMLKAVPDPIQHPLAMPSYCALNGISHQWNETGLDYELFSECGGSQERDFNLVVSDGAIGTGSSRLSGLVRWGVKPNKVAAEDPIPGVDVVVEKVPPGNAFAHAVTDGNGIYTFDDVPVLPEVGAVYRIYVSMPGYPMDDTYYITINADDTDIDSLDFVVDPDLDSIYPLWPSTNVAIGEQPVAEPLSLRPNPMHERMTVVLPESFGRLLSYCIRSVDGRLMREERLDTALRFDVERGTLSAGVYILEAVNAEGQRMTERMVLW